MAYKIRPIPGMFRDPSNPNIRIKITEVYQSPTNRIPNSFNIPLAELETVSFNEVIVHDGIIDLKISKEDLSTFVVSAKLLEVYDETIPETDENN